MLDQVVRAVKQKRELASLDDNFVLEKVKKILKKEKKIRTKLDNSKSFKEFSRSKDFKELKSKVREELRKVYGVFQKKKGSSPLLAHQSSEERYDYYPEIYQKLFTITGKPETIIDLGCGANPYSYEYLSCTPFYMAMDLPSEDLKEIAAFFKKNKIKGEVLGIDLVKEYDKLALLLKDNPFDVAFLFKLLDSLETVKKNISIKLLEAVNATWLIVSFPTVSIGGRKHIKKERRAWFEKLLTRKGWHWEELTIGEEVFYVVLKDPQAIAQKRYAANADKLTKYYETQDVSHLHDRFLQLVSGKRILEAGCAGGRDLEFFSSEGYETVGFDVCKEMVEIARKKAPKARVLQADIKSLPFKASSFDGIWCLTVLVNFYDEDVRKALSELHRVLAPGGVLFLGLKEGKSSMEHKTNQQVYVRRFTEKEVLKFATGFTLIDSIKLYRVRTHVKEKGSFLYLFLKKD